MRTRTAEEVLGHELRPGEHAASSTEVTSNPSRWVSAAFLALAIALTVTSLVSLFGPWPYRPIAGFPAPLIPLAVLLLPRPMLVAVTNQRLICFRLSRFHRVPRQLAFAVPLAEVRIVKYRPGKFASSIQLEIPGHKRTWLAAAPARRKEWARMEAALTRSGVFAKLDPPWPPQTRRAAGEWN